MGLSNIGMSLAQKTANWAKSGVLHTKPIGNINFKNLKYAPALEKDTVEFAQKNLKQIRTDADEILKNLRRSYDAEYIETRTPEIVENVAKGNITTQGELAYMQYKQLETLCKENPEFIVLLGKEKGSCLDLRSMISNYGDTIREIAKEVPVEQIKQTFTEVDSFSKKWEFEPNVNHYMNMLIMKKYNPETYKYLMTTSDIRISYRAEVWGNHVPSASMLKSITPAQMHTMGYDVLPPIMKNIGAYVEDSDAFVRNKAAVQELSNDLAKCKLSQDVELYRGEKTVGMFDGIRLDSDMEKQIRRLLEENKDSAKNTSITTYTGRYNCGPSTNLYDFLSSKEHLTLADAMQAAKYGDEKFVNEIIGRIKDSKVVDTRFKSLSFDKGMAAGWRSHNSGDNTTIVQNATVKQGTQGGFHCGNNEQFEVILNNTPKEMSFQNVVYNKETDTFELNSTIQNLNP